MIRPPTPNETLRLQSLRELQILDTTPEAAFDEIAQLAARLCEVPMALIRLVDSDRQWFKARVGLAATETPREQSFCDLTDNLVSGLGATARNIRLVLEAEDLQLSIDTAIPCGLIVNELVMNAYKHGFPGGRPGIVKLGMRRSAEGRLWLEVADNGQGIPAGVDLQQTQSLGMQLVFTLIRQLRGTITVHRGSGARFEMEFPEVHRK